MEQRVNQSMKTGLILKGKGEGVCRCCLLVLLMMIVPILTSVTYAQSSERSSSSSGGPKFEDQFNCLCDIKVKENGELDTSQNCGKNLANCQCSFSEKMRKQLNKLDRKGLSRIAQIRWMKEEYKKFGKKVLAVPDPESGSYYLGYVVPPIVIFLGILFAGSIGWYWLRDDGDEVLERERGEVTEDIQDFKREIEQELEERDEQSP